MILPLVIKRYGPGARIGLLLALGLFLAATSCTPYEEDYRYIPPRHEVRNSPIPVPHPRLKPQPPPLQTAQGQAAGGGVSPRPKPSGGGMRVYTVRKGDTVYGIARAHGIEVRDVVHANGLRAPYTLSIGQRLSVPVSGKHVVHRGETTYSISRMYGIDQNTLARLNGLKPPYTIGIGQELRLPASASAAATTSTGPKPPLADPPPRRSSKFLWPVSGQVLVPFGPTARGLHNDGINIATRAGAPVRAAEAGVVAYAGNGLKGFGHLLLVRHADGWVTAYAHNERLLVSRGDKVERGEVIARAGTSGAVNRPQLHFEIRRGTRAVDPQRYLGRS